MEPFSEYPDQAAFKGLSARKLQQMANDNTLRRLAAAVNGQAAAATFACGGSIQFSSCLRTYDSIDDDGIVPCFQLQWDTKDGAGGKVRFPLTSDDQVRLQGLVEACRPASFGLGGKEVLDQSYRKAGKLDRSEFLTDFHPHDCGIIDSIRQILLPSMTKGGGTLFPSDSFLFKTPIWVVGHILGAGKGFFPTYSLVTGLPTPLRVTRWPSLPLAVLLDIVSKLSLSLKTALTVKSLSEGIGIGTRGVRAELYKLNVSWPELLIFYNEHLLSSQVYSGPSGMFNAHVDTPRGAKNFGSLVVCLPCSHEGKLSWRFVTESGLC